MIETSDDRFRNLQVYFIPLFIFASLMKIYRFTLARRGRWICFSLFFCFFFFSKSRSYTHILWEYVLLALNSDRIKIRATITCIVPGDRNILFYTSYISLPKTLSIIPVVNNIHQAYNSRTTSYFKLFTRQFAFCSALDLFHDVPSFFSLSASHPVSQDITRSNRILQAAVQSYGILPSCSAVSLRGQIMRACK